MIGAGQRDWVLMPSWTRSFQRAVRRGFPEHVRATFCDSPMVVSQPSVALYRSSHAEVLPPAGAQQRPVAGLICVCVCAYVESRVGAINCRARCRATQGSSAAAVRLPHAVFVWHELEGEQAARKKECVRASPTQRRQSRGRAVREVVS